MAKGIAPIDHSKAALLLCGLLHSCSSDEFTELSYISYVELRNHTPPTATNQECSKDMVEALMLAGAIPKRDLKKVRSNSFITIPVIDLHKVLQYIMEIRGLLEPINDEFKKPTKQQMAKLIAYTGNTYSKVCEPGWYKGIYNLFYCSDSAIINADYDLYSVDLTSKIAEASISDQLEAFITDYEFDYTDLYSLFPSEIKVDSDGDRYQRGVMLRSSQEGSEILHSVGLLLTSTIREDLKQAIGQGFLTLATMYRNAKRRRKYCGLLLLEQLVKAPEVYVMNLHKGISKICQLLLEDPDAGPEVIARIKKRIRL